MRADRGVNASADEGFQLPTYRVNSLEKAVEERSSEVVWGPKVKPAQTIGVLWSLPDGRSAETEDRCGRLTGSCRRWSSFRG